MSPATHAETAAERAAHHLAAARSARDPQRAAREARAYGHVMALLDATDPLVLAERAERRRRRP